MTQTHTPGPWEYDDSGKDFARRTIRRNGIVIAHVAEARGTQFNGMEPTPVVTQANARLIAAAPAMYEALAQIAAHDCKEYSCLHLYPGTLHNGDKCGPHLARAALAAALSREIGGKP